MREPETITINGADHQVVPYHGPRHIDLTFACKCPGMVRLLDARCVCRAVVYCEAHGIKHLGSHE